jgi:hypothetical protein
MMVADTDVLIDFLDGRPPAAARIALELDRGQLGTMVMTRFELLVGAKTSSQQRVVGHRAEHPVGEAAQQAAMPLERRHALGPAHARRLLDPHRLGGHLPHVLALRCWPGTAAARISRRSPEAGG